ncbi:hypothetical protein Tco_0453216 [Tanacetum coccineum]
MFILYCRRSMNEDYMMAREINRVCGELNDIVMERSRFIEELDSLVGWLVPEKMAELLKEIQRKDDQRVSQLQILVRETELRAREKELFIRKLKGLIASVHGWPVASSPTRVKNVNYALVVPSVTSALMLYLFFKMGYYSEFPGIVKQYLLVDVYIKGFCVRLLCKHLKADWVLLQECALSISGSSKRYLATWRGGFKLNFSQNVYCTRAHGNDHWSFHLIDFAFFELSGKVVPHGEFKDVSAVARQFTYESRDYVSCPEPKQWIEVLYIVDIHIGLDSVDAAKSYFSHIWYAFRDPLTVNFCFQYTVALSGLQASNSGF